MSRLALLAATLLGAVFCLAGCGDLSSMSAAVRSRDPQRVLAFAAAKPRIKTAYGNTVRTIDLSLYAAANQGDLAMVRALVAEGADGRIPDVLEIAAQSGHYSVVQFLLDQGADPHARLVWGGSTTPLDAALQYQRGEVVALMSARTRGAAPAAPAPPVQAAPRGQPGNLDDAGYERMRAAAGMPPEKRGPASDVDSPSRTGAERPDDFALVIGVETYQSLPKADHGERDAKTVRRHLEALGFPARNIVSLEGSGATKSKLESYLKEWLPLNVKPTSTLFVYYSGHGAPDPKSGDAYLVPWDGDPKFLKSTAYPLTSLYADLSKTKAKRVIVALDACFSGAGGRSVLAQGARPLVAKVAEVATGERLTVLAAASGDEITGTLEEQGHGIFTYHLLKGLAADPKASAKALHGYLLPKVQDDARRQNREQTPTLAGASLDAPLLP